MSIFPRALCLGSLLSLAACFSPGGQLPATSGDSSTGANTNTTTNTSTTSEPTTTTTPATTTAPTTTGSTGDACGPCPLGSPYCTPSGDCIGCGQFPANDMSCDDFPAKPFCDQVDGVGSGMCVQCLAHSDCPGQACDPDSHSCVELAVACDTHDDCKFTACEIDVGTCFPIDSTRWYVDPIGCNGSECMKGAPCCTIGAALTQANSAKDDKYHVIQVTPGNYTDRLVLDKTGSNVAILGTSGVTLDITEDGGALVLFGENLVAPPPHLDSKLFLSRLALTGNGQSAILCLNAAFLGLDEVTIDGVNGGDALSANMCKASIRRSQLLRNTGGLALSQATVALENSIIAGCTQRPALTLELESQLDILYSTVARQNDLPGGLLTCLVQMAIAPGIVNIRNSAVLAGPIGAPVACMAAINTSNSAVTDPFLDNGQNNASVNADSAGAPFMDWVNSDLHVKDGGNFLQGRALWKTGDPATDIDGLLRPVMDGISDEAGADLPGMP